MGGDRQGQNNPAIISGAKASPGIERALMHLLATNRIVAAHEINVCMQGIFDSSRKELEAVKIIERLVL